jgi:uncharacterized protein (DUF1697 family)
MIILRQVQLTVIELPGVMKYVNALCKDARKQFKDEIDSLTDTTLEKKICKSIKKAQQFHLLSKADWGRFVFITIENDWDFDEDPDNEWMVTMLEDPEITSPSDRLTRLIDECIYRKEVALQNEKLWDDFYGADSDGDDFDDDEFDDEEVEYNEVSSTESQNT